MVVVTGPATATSWLAIAGLLFLHQWPPAELATSTSSFSPLQGGDRAEAATTTTVLTTSTSYLRGKLLPEFESSAVMLVVTFLVKFLPASFAQCIGWLVTALIGAAVGRCTRRRVSPDPVPKAEASAPLSPSRLPSVPRPRPSLTGTSPTKTGGVIKPSARRALQNGGRTAKDV